MILYNPDWRLDKIIKKWILHNEKMTGLVYPQDTMDYKWEVYLNDANAEPIAKGVAYDRIEASAAVEKQLGYHFFIEPEYVMTKGCRCGCCEDPTGKWKVWNRDDSINLLFDSEADAVAWVANVSIK